MTDTTLYPGDTGTLPAETRRVLVNLMRGPMLDGLRQPKLWAVLVRDEAVIRSRLHELFLALVLDLEQQVAFVQQAEVGELDAPTLLRKSTLAFNETALLLHLRAQLAIADAQGERCVVERDDLLEHLKAYRPADESDLVRFDRQSETAIEKLSKLGLLHRLKGNDNAMEVSQALRLLFGIEEIEALTRTYEALQNGGADAAALVDPAVSEPEAATGSTPALEDSAIGLIGAACPVPDCVTLTMASPDEMPAALAELTPEITEPTETEAA